MADDDPKNFTLDRFLPYRVNLVASRISRQLAEVYRDRFGISIAEWRVIAHLAHHRRISVREVYARADMDKSKVSRAAARLQAAGIITKRPSRADRRLIEMSLTPKGRALFGRIAPLVLDFERRILADLDAAERTALAAGLEKVLGALDREAAGAD